MAIIARELRDTPNGRTWQLKRSRVGFEGTKWFYVNTDLEDSALLAENLPKIGEPWSQAEELRLCVVTEIGPTERMGGRDRGDGTGGGITHVPVRYQSLSSTGGGGNEPPKAQGHLDRWCSVRNNLTTELIKYPVDDDDEPQTDRDQILNGQGTARPVVELDYLVSVAYDLTRGQPDFDRLDRLGDPCHTNRGSVTFPPILRTTATRTKAPGECLYRGYSLSQEGELLVVEHTISVRAGGVGSWKLFYEHLDETGEADRSNIAQVVPSADWGGLFS